MDKTLERILDPKTYEGAKVQIPAAGWNSVHVDGVLGTSLRLTFSLVINEWQITLRVSGAFMDRPEPNHFLLYSHLPVDDRVKALWRFLRDSKSAGDSDGFDQRCEEAMKILAAGKPAATKGKK